jgi:hypothetical protein
MSNNWLYWVVFGTAAGAVLFVVVRWRSFHKRNPGCTLDTPLGSAAWDPTKSWGSTLTVVGALLGTILSSKALPATTTVPAATYAGLNLFFGILIMIAPLTYAAMQRKKQVQLTAQVEEAQYQATVLWFLVYAALTLWAVSGELFTVGRLFIEIRDSASLPGLILGVTWLAVLGAVVFIVLYAWKSIDSVLTDQTQLWRLPSETARRMPELLRAGEVATMKLDDTKLARPSWSLL